MVLDSLGIGAKRVDSWAVPLGGANAMVLDSVGIGAKRVGNWAAVDRWRQRHDFGFCRHRREES